MVLIINYRVLKKLKGKQNKTLREKVLNMSLKNPESKGWGKSERGQNKNFFLVLFFK